MKRSCAWMAALALGTSLAAGAQAEDTIGKVKKKGVLVAGVADDAPPFSFLDKGSRTVVGYDVDLVTAIANRLGVKVELRAATSQINRFSELIAGNVDILAANLTHSESHARESIIDLTDHYLSTGQRFLAKRGTVRIHEDLKGKRIGAVTGMPSESCARDRCEGATVVPYDDYALGIQALQKGTIDVFTSDQVILLDLLASLPKGDYEIPELQISEEQYHLGVRKGDKNFLDFVNKAIREMQQGGESAKIKEKWFAPREQRPPSAYGAVVRRAATPPRFLAVILNGIFFPKAEASIFSLNGTYLGSGKVVSVSGDEFYLDVDQAQYDLVQPGFLVAMDMSNETAKDIVMRHQDILKSIKAESGREAEKLQAGIEREGIEKQERRQEADRVAEQYRLSERSNYFYRYGY